MSKTVGTRKMRMNQDGYVAEVILGRETGLYHYVISKEDSIEIVAWGQENTVESARKCIDDYIDYQKNRKKTAG